MSFQVFVFPVEENYSQYLQYSKRTILLNYYFKIFQMSLIDLSMEMLEIFSYILVQTFN